MPPGLTGCYIKVHHAVLDGQAGVLLAHAHFDLTPRPRGVVGYARAPGFGFTVARALEAAYEEPKAKTFAPLAQPRCPAAQGPTSLSLAPAPAPWNV